MSERLSHQHERSGEQNHESATHKESARKHAEKKAEPARHEHAEKLHEIRNLIEKTAKSKEAHSADKNEYEHSKSKEPVLINRELKDIAYRRTLKRVQNKLPAPARTFSKVIHNPAVEAVSDITGKTLARPSGILAGGIAAFLGSTFFLWIARHYGYEYNFLLFALCFVGGFAIGIALELGVKLGSRRNR